MAFKRQQQQQDVAMVEEVNVVHLSASQERGAHRCGFNCIIDHIWGNLFLCKSSGTTHVCDKNCDQRIVYDNHSSICRASRQIFPLHQQQTVQGLRRKQQCTEASPSKRNRCSLSSQEGPPFKSTNVNMVQCAPSAADASMDMA